MRFLVSCFEFYRSILTRYVEPPGFPPEKPWCDGTLE